MSREQTALCENKLAERFKLNTSKWGAIKHSSISCFYKKDAQEFFFYLFFAKKDTHWIPELHFFQ